MGGVPRTRIVLFVVLLLLIIISFASEKTTKDEKGEDDENQGTKNFKEEMKFVMEPVYKKMMRLPWKTCSNWEEIQTRATDFTVSQRDCIAKCFQRDDCSGVLILIGQERGCRYLAGTCMVEESYEWEYYHKFVPFTLEPFVLGIDDRSVRFKLSQMVPTMARCWLYRCSEGATKCFEDPNYKENAFECRQAVMGLIQGASHISHQISEKEVEVWFDLLEQETEYMIRCANSAGSKTKATIFKTTTWPLDFQRNEKRGCIDALKDKFQIGFFKRVGLMFCRNMCMRRKCFSYMYGRPDGKHGGECILTASCGRRALVDMEEWNSYTPFNLDYDIMQTNAKCTPLPKELMGDAPIPPIKSLGAGLRFPIQCRKACYQQPQCEYFLFGKQGTPNQGVCMQINADCRTYESSLHFDVWKLTRLDWTLWKMGAECLGGGQYFDDKFTFDECKQTCKNTPTCNYFMRADMGPTDKGLCIGANQCDKTRRAEGFFVYQSIIPPPLVIDDIVQKDKGVDVKRSGQGGEDKYPGGSGAGGEEKKEKENNERRNLELAAARRELMQIRKSQDLPAALPKEIFVPVISSLEENRNHWGEGLSLAWMLLTHRDVFIYGYSVIFVIFGLYYLTQQS